MKNSLKKPLMIALFIGMTGCTRCDGSKQITNDIMTPAPEETLIPTTPPETMMDDTNTLKDATALPSPETTPGETPLTPNTVQ